MSKNDVVIKDETAIAVANFHPVNDMPDKAPKPQIDLDNPNLSFDDVLPSDYFSMEDLQIWLEREAESRILTVTGASVEFVYDPVKGEESGEWKPCLSFAETGTMLALTRAGAAVEKADEIAVFERLGDGGAGGREAKGLKSRSFDGKCFSNILIRCVST